MENTTKQSKEIKKQLTKSRRAKQKTKAKIVKNYIVHYYNSITEKHKREAYFKTLPDAREFGTTRLHTNTFISLKNKKGVVLPL